MLTLVRRGMSESLNLLAAAAAMAACVGGSLGHARSRARRSSARGFTDDLGVF